VSNKLKELFDTLMIFWQFEREMKTETKCINPNCDGKPLSRGLCSACYQAAINAVLLGKITWKALEKAGKCLPSRKSTKRNWLLAK